MVPVGGVIVGVIAPDYNSAEWFVFGWFLVFLGVGTWLIGAAIRRQNIKTSITYSKLLLYPVLLALSPIIYIVLKFLPMVRNSKLIQNMVKVASEGEVLYESAPQLTLQLYIVLSTLEPTGWTWFSITTSCLSLLVALVHSQYIENLPNSSWRDYVKSTIVILPNMIFRILSLRYIKPISKNDASSQGTSLQSYQVRWCASYVGIIFFFEKGFAYILYLLI